MNQREISSETAAVRIDYRPLSRELLGEIRAFFADPRNEAEYQEWKRTQGRREKECSSS